MRHLFAAYDLGTDNIYGHIKTNKRRTTFLAFCRYLRSLYPHEVRIAIVLDNFSPTSPPGSIPASVTGLETTTSSWRTYRPTPHG